jgi:Pyridoxamine 5'-phosphate oxidase
VKLDESVRRVVREQSLGFVATVCPDGTANVSPKGTVAAWDDEHLVFLDLRSPGTVRNLAGNPSMEINVSSIRCGARATGSRAGRGSSHRGTYSRRSSLSSGANGPFLGSGSAGRS